MKVRTAQSPVPIVRPPKTTPGRNVILYKQPPLPEAIPGSGRSFTESPLKQILADISSRAISPRAMQTLSLDLYAIGIITWEEHEDLAFQAELHPDFPRTIGALTGDKPRPDHPRDFVKEWEGRLDFERRHSPEGGKRERALRILSVLRRIDSPTNVTA